MTGAQPTVLIVDDSEGVCLALSMMLEKSGFHTHTAHNATEGLRLANEHDCDVILLDRNIGRESGLMLAEQLLQLNPTLRIVMMSGSVTMHVEMDCRPEVRSLPLLQKPFTRQELLDCLRSVMDQAA
jgi:DNA-binding NtrC family response regulator